MNPLPLSPAALPLAPGAANTRSSAGQLHHQSVQNTRFGSGCRPPPRRPGKRPDRRFAFAFCVTVGHRRPRAVVRERGYLRHRRLAAGWWRGGLGVGERGVGPAGGQAGRRMRISAPIAGAGRSRSGRARPGPPPQRPRQESQRRRPSMGEHHLHRHVEISDSQGTVASADVTVPQESDRTARASLRATAGHLTPGVRASLVDAVWTCPRCKTVRAWRPPFPWATARHCTGSGSDARTSGPTQPGQLRWWRRTSDLALSPGTVQEPACNHLPGCDRGRREGAQRSAHASALMWPRGDERAAGPQPPLRRSNGTGPYRALTATPDHRARPCQRATHVGRRAPSAEYFAASA